MNQLSVQNQPMDITISEIENTRKLCEILLATPHYKKLGPEGIYAIVAKAKSLKVDVQDALNGGLYFVQGKVGMSAEMMAALIRKENHSIVKDPKSNNDICILHGKRADNGDTWMVSFSIDDARRAGLAKNMYDKYPGIMLYNRAMSMLARQLFPDVIKGAGYTHDELLEIKEKNVSIQTVEYNSAPIEVEEKPSCITKEQASDLDSLLNSCDPNYKEQVFKNLRVNFSIDSLENLTFELFDRIKLAAIKKKSEYEEILRQQQVEVANV